MYVILVPIESHFYHHILMRKKNQKYLLTFFTKMSTHAIQLYTEQNTLQFVYVHYNGHDDCVYVAHPLKCPDVHQWFTIKMCLKLQPPDTSGRIEKISQYEFQLFASRKIVDFSNHTEMELNTYEIRIILKVSLNFEFN